MHRFFNKIDQDKLKCDTNKNKNQCDVENSVSSDTRKGSKVQSTDLRDRTKMLELWLKEYEVFNVTRKRQDETLLLMCLRSDQSDSCIMQLIEVECEVNATNRYGEYPLHCAVKRPTLIVAIELIKRGANINAQDNRKYTPLHYAVLANHEAVCMLLYYGADVSVRRCDMFSPLGIAIKNERFASIQMLMDYHEDEDLYEEIDLFMYFDRNPLLKLIVKSKNSRSFKLAWTYINHNNLTNLCPLFLETYLDDCSFPTNEWFECLQLILHSDGIVDRIEHFNSRNLETFISLLLRAFYEKQIEINNRMSTIFTVLSLGTKIYLHDCYYAFQFFGFGAELEALIYAVDYTANYGLYSPKVFWFALLPFILGLSNDFSSTTIVYLMKKQIWFNHDINSDMKQNHNANALHFFSFNSNAKAKLLKICSKCDYDNYQMKKVLDEIPEVPSLLELSRNRIYLSIRNGHKIKKPYHFHDAVKNLLLPQKLKDMIIFKAPIY